MLVPYVLGYLLAGPDTAFTGIIMNQEDSQTYFAKMLQGYDGQWLYYIPFTAEAHEPVFLGGIYLALGQLARVSGLTVEAVWHGARIVADLLLFLTTYWFIAAFIERREWRVVAYLLALFGSGLGWMLFLMNQPLWLGTLPVDFHMPEAHLFFTAFTFPHVALGTALLLIILRTSVRVQDGEASWMAVVGTGLCNLLIVIAYPFLIYLVILTNGLYFLWRWWQSRRFAVDSVIRLGLTFVPSAPLVLYYALVLQQNEVFAAWDIQAATPSPPWPHYLLAFGPLLLLAFLAQRSRPRLVDPTLLWIWILAAALLLYAPLNPQRRFVQGVHVPLSILATVGFLGVLLPRLLRVGFFQALLRRPRYTAQGLRRLLTVFFLAFMSLSNLYVFASVTLTAVVEQPYPLYRPQDEVRATQWLRQNSTPDAVVLGAYQTGNYVAARAGNRVVLGHWAETMDIQQKLAAVERFYDEETGDDWRQGLLAEQGVSFVWYGPQEQELGAFDPATVDYLRPVHEVGQITVYRVTSP
jgi:hypothetical protein